MSHHFLLLFQWLFFTRSSYFQQIEEDVQRYTKQITELRSAITNFKTKDMIELVKFHKDVESVLENLTDESQVSLETTFMYYFACSFDSVIQNSIAV